MGPWLIYPNLALEANKIVAIAPNTRLVHTDTIIQCNLASSIYLLFSLCSHHRVLQHVYKRVTFIISSLTYSENSCNFSPTWFPPYHRLAGTPLPPNSQFTQGKDNSHRLGEALQLILCHITSHCYTFVAWHPSGMQHTCTSHLITLLVLGFPMYVLHQKYTSETLISPHYILNKICGEYMYLPNYFSSRENFTLRLQRLPFFLLLLFFFFFFFFFFFTAFADAPPPTGTRSLQEHLLVHCHPTLCYVIAGQWTGKILLRLYSSFHGNSVLWTRLFPPSSSSQVPPTNTPRWCRTFTSLSLNTVSQSHRYARVSHRNQECKSRMYVKLILITHSKYCIPGERKTGV